MVLAVSLSAQDRSAGQRADLQFRVVEASGPAHVAGSRSRSAMTVEVLGSGGEPVPGAAVTIQLPSSGPGGVFGNGSATDVVTTGPDGRASAGGVTWSRTPGAFDLRVTVARGPARVSAAFPHRILASLEGSPAGVAAGRSRKKYVAIIAGVAAGAVVAGLAAGRRSAGGSAAPGTGEPAVTVLAPSITVGAP
jgi:hypothetical protein